MPKIKKYNLPVFIIFQIGPIHFKCITIILLFMGLIIVVINIMPQVL